MDITGKYIQNLPVQTGEGKNGTWTKGSFVIETEGERFPKKICFTTWGDQVNALDSFSVGDTLKVSFDAESREYNGRWFTDLKSWKIEKVGASTPNNNTPPAQKPLENNTNAPVVDMTQDDDLPF